MSESERSCRLPQDTAVNEQTAIRQMLQAKRIAIVGLSADPSRPSYDVASYLLSTGYEVIPINPNYESVLGQRCYASLSEVDGPIGIVNVFRRPEHCETVAAKAVAAGATGIWLQSGIRCARAKQLALGAKIPFVEDRCIKVEHRLAGFDRR